MNLSHGGLSCRITGDPPDAAVVRARVSHDLASGKKQSVGQSATVTMDSALERYARSTGATGVQAAEHDGPGSAHPHEHGFDRATLGLGLCTAATGIVHAVNAAFCDLLGRDEATIVGRRLSEIGIDVAADLPAALSAGGEIRAHLTRPDGRALPVLLSPLQPAASGAGDTLLVLADRAAQVSIDAERQLLDARLSALIARARDLLILMDERLDVLYASPSVYALLGASPETPARELTFVDAMSPEQYRQSDAEIRASAATGQPRRFTSEFRTADGQTRTYDMLFDSRLDDPTIRAVVATGRDITERVVAEQALRVLDRRYSALIQQSRDILLIWNLEAQRYTFASPSLYTSLGIPEGPPQELRLRELFHPTTFATAAAAMQASRSTGVPQRADVGIIDAAGGVHWYDVLFADHSDDPDIGGILIAGRDITERVVAEQALQTLDTRFTTLIAGSPDLHVLLGERFEPVWISASTYRFLGISPGAPFVEALRDAVSAADIPGFGEDLARVMATGEVVRREARAIDADGHERWFDVVMSNHASEPSLGGILLIGRDITELYRTEQAMQRLALSDPLTGLANRARFIDRLAAALNVLDPGEYAAVLLVNIDTFRRFNEALGHGAGDEALRIVAARLGQEVGPRGLVARFSGDRFAVMLDRATQEEAERLATALAARVAEPLLLQGRPRYLTASVGLTLATSGSDAWTVYNESVIAQRQATSDGAARVTRFEPGMGATARRRIELETDLRRALDDDQFRLVYQPLVEIRTSRLVSLEALIRWEHPERGAVSPTEFIPFAEETGLIEPIGAWVVDAACAMMRRLLDLRPGGHCPGIDLNLSRRQFRQHRLVDDIAAAIGRHGVDPALIGFEVTETAASLDAGLALEVLGGLRELGVRLALDDFGAGYSSLGLLDRWPVQGLKLDRGLTAAVGDARRAAIARAVTTLGRDLGMTITAEGIETREQHLAMAALGCDIGQGYFFARPMSAAEVIAAIAADPAPIFPRLR